MDELSGCPRCGKFLTRDFRFCPHCGMPKPAGEDWETLLDQCLEPLEHQERKILLDRILTLEAKIADLDREVDRIFDRKLASIGR